MNILIVQLKRIGDTILTAPALERIRRSFPDASITLILHGPSGQLAPVISQADEVIVYQTKSSNIGLWWKVATTRWHMVCDFTGSDRSALITALSRASIRATYDRYRKSSLTRAIFTEGVDASVRELSTVDFHLALANALANHGTANHATDDAPQSFLTLDHQVKLEQPLADRYAVLHPGTARDEKYWVTDRWADVAGRLRSHHDLDIVITGSNDQREQSHLIPLRTLLCERGIPFTDLSGKLSLADTARVIGDATLVVTVDSAAMHLAAQFGCRQVGLFGPTNPYHWAPTHPAARVILASAPDQVTSSFTPKHTKAEMVAIPASSVISAANELLAP